MLTAGYLGDTATYLLNLVAYGVFAALLIAACVTDLRERLIPNRIPLGIAGTWLLWKGGASGAFGAELLSGALAALIVGGALLVFTLVFEALAKRPGMGGGDVKLLAACTLFLGLEGSAICLLVACVAAIPLSLIIPRTRFARTDERAGALPFAPAIALGALAVLLCYFSTF